MTGKIKWIPIASILLLFPLNKTLHGQERKEQKIVFHVTAVRSAAANDWCSSGDCNATRLTVEGYVQLKGNPHVTEYVLACVQLLPNKPSPDFVATQCVHVHANTDYDATLRSTQWSSSIFFTEPSATEQHDPAHYVVEGFNILSEKEVSKSER
jgi:hypothetical protein